MNLEPTDDQLDALREIANIGCGHAANALSRLVGGAVRIDVPRVIAVPSAEVAEVLGGPQAPALAATLSMEGGLRGRMMITWNEPDARRLCELLLGTAAEGSLLEEPLASALCEVANIVASACLSAIARLTDLRLLPSPPHLTLETLSAAAHRMVRDNDPADSVVVLEARFFTAETPPLSGHLLIVPEKTSLPILFNALGL